MTVACFSDTVGSIQTGDSPPVSGCCMVSSRSRPESTKQGNDSNIDPWICDWIWAFDRFLWGLVGVSHSWTIQRCFLPSHQHHFNGIRSYPISATGQSHFKMDRCCSGMLHRRIYTINRWYIFFQRNCVFWKTSLPWKPSSLHYNPILFIASSTSGQL